MEYHSNTRGNPNSSIQIRPTDLEFLLMEANLPMPNTDTDKMLEAVVDPRVRLQYQIHLAFLRGNFTEVLACYRQLAGDDAARLCASFCTLIAALYLGDNQQFEQIERWLQAVIQENLTPSITAIAELALANAYLTVHVPQKAPKWLKQGNFTALPASLKPSAVCARIKYFHSIRNIESMLTISQTAQSFFTWENGITFQNIYFLIYCSIACLDQRRIDEANSYLSEALKMGLSQGFITPFAESAPAFGGLLERLLQQDYPEYSEKIRQQWKQIFMNWSIFHNRFTGDNITDQLSLRDYELALLVAAHVPYKEIASLYNISVGRVKNKMSEIYSLLLINSRDGLDKRIV